MRCTPAATTVFLVLAGCSQPAAARLEVPESVRAEVCQRWRDRYFDFDQGTWNGRIEGCIAGEISARERAAALRLVNVYRWLAGLPAVETDPERDRKAQECALLMHANRRLDHHPDSSWTCYSEDGAEAARLSNLALGPVANAVSDYMADLGNEETLGHRRWILSSALGPIGLGSTTSSSCMWVQQGTGSSDRPFAAWPPPGPVPLEALGVDRTGWSVQSETIDLAGAQVAVSEDGAARAVGVTPLPGRVGSWYGVRFTPVGWSTRAERRYSVRVTAAGAPIEYTVEVISCP